MRCGNCDVELIPGKPFCHACGARVNNSCPSCGAPLQQAFRFCPDCGTSLASTTLPPAIGAAVGLQTPSPPSAARPPTTLMPGLRPGLFDAVANFGGSVPNVAAGPQAAAFNPGGFQPSPSTASNQPKSRSGPRVPEELAQKIRASQDAIEGERKQVTVMFCDLAGSTALAEQLDPEEYHDLLDEYLELAFRAVYRYEGLVNQLAGDGFMALFGAPLAHEDAPQRAVHAALEIQRELAVLNQRLDGERGLTLRARVGIHTGPVVVGAVGNDFKMDYSAVGDTTNLAARLESMAQPGSVLVSESTYRLIRARFEVRRVGPLTVKGKREPINAYEVLQLTAAARQEPSAPMALSADRALTPFVGRDPELAQLLACYERLADLLPQLIAVVGAAGCGKSRLLYEFKERLQDQTVTWFEIRCSAWTQMAPYAPFGGMLRRYFDVMPDDPTDQVRDKIAQKVRVWDPELNDLYPWLCRILKIHDEHGAELSDDEMKSGTFQAMGDLIHYATQTGPVIMLIEDLHWMDEPSRIMLQAASENMMAWPFMLLVSHRPDFHPVWRTHAALTQLNLRRLSDESTTAIIRAIAGGPLPDELEARVREKSEGSPFLAEEITRSIMEEGSLNCAEGEPISCVVDDIRIPGTVQEVIAARLDRLPPHAKRAVQVAAVMGRQFGRSNLVEVLRDEGIDVDEQLEELERRGVVHRRDLFSKDEYRFGESLTQEVAYEGLLLKQRRQLHERIGLIIENHPAPPDAERSALLVHHFGLSDNRAKTIQALLRSANEAEKVPSYTTAARLYRQAWDLAQSSLEKTADEHLQKLAADAVSGIGRMAVIYNVPDPGDNDAVFAKARRSAEARNDFGALAGLHTYEGLLLMNRGPARFADGLAVVEAGLDLARRAEDPMPSITISRALAYGYMLDGRIDLALRTFDWVLDQLSRLGHAQRLTDVYCGTRWMRDRTIFFNDDLETSQQLTHETLGLSMRAGNRTVRGSALLTLGHIAMLRGDYSEALRWTDEAMGVMTSLGTHANVPVAAAVAILINHAIGKRDNTPRHVEMIMQHTMPSNDLALNSHVISEALLSAGEIGLAERRAQMAYERGGGRLRELHALLGLAAVHAHHGALRWPDASQSYDRAVALAEALNLRSAIASATFGQAQLLARHGNHSESSRLLRRAAALWRELGITHYVGHAEEQLHLLGNGHEAEAATG